MIAQVTQMAVKRQLHYCKAQSFARMDQATSTNLYSIIMNSNGKGQRLDLAQVYEFLAQVDLAQV